MLLKYHAKYHAEDISSALEVKIRRETPLVLKRLIPPRESCRAGGVLNGTSHQQAGTGILELVDSSAVYWEPRFPFLAHILHDYRMPLSLPTPHADKFFFAPR